MNVLFLTMNVFTDIEMHNIYSDLMKEFVKHGHRPYIVTPREKKFGEKTELVEYSDYSILKIQIGNTSNVSFVEKGISTVLLQNQFMYGIKKYLKEIHFDLILYSTPPITFGRVIGTLKKKHKATTYLMLKDIFPQNAVDLGMFSKRSPIYYYFRKQEKKLYQLSDRIGCMSPANVSYIMKHNPYLNPLKIEICPNAITPNPVEDRGKYKVFVHKKYGIPSEATVFIFGGNLGKPQGIPFLIRCLEALKSRTDCYFIICGSGSEFESLKEFTETQRPKNVRLVRFLPKAEYDELVKGCDVGLIFLDYRFTIPNYPSRILTYFEYAMPVVVCTDNATDIGQIAEKSGFGYLSKSNDVSHFVNCVDKMCKSDIVQMGKLARSYLENSATANIAYSIVVGEYIK